MTEAEITKQIEDYLNKAGIFWWKNWAGGRRNRSYSKAGISDILGITKKEVCCPHCQGKFDVDGIFTGIEIKAHGKKPTKPTLQTEFINSVNRQGGVGFFADCLDDVIRGLK